MVKRRELEKVARQQQHKHAYDSDEETDNETGTWEHRLRAAEMDITRGSMPFILFFNITINFFLFRMGC